MEKLKETHPGMTLDDTKDFGILFDAAPARTLGVRNPEDITWVTQCSIEHLPRIARLAEEWQVCVFPFVPSPT